MLERIAVIGAGTMGNGIAHIFAQSGFNVHLIDVNTSQLEKAIQTITKNFDRQIAKQAATEESKATALKNIKTFGSIADGIRDVELVIEAATENTELKLKIFKELDTYAPENCILASNTSSISITKIASVTNRPAKVIGMHFMNPVPVMKEGGKTLQEIEMTPVDKTKAFHKVYLLVDKKTQTIYSTRVLEKNGNKYSYIVNSLNGKAAIADDVFVFNKSKYPGVEEVDLRQ